MCELKSCGSTVKAEVCSSERDVRSVTLSLINDQINQIKTLKWIYSVIINDSLQVKFDVKEQGRFQLYHYDSHV